MSDAKKDKPGTLDSKKDKPGTLDSKKDKPGTLDSKKDKPTKSDAGACASTANWSCGAACELVCSAGGVVRRIKCFTTTIITCQCVRSDLTGGMCGGFVYYGPGTATLDCQKADIGHGSACWQALSDSNVACCRE